MLRVVHDMESSMGKGQGEAVLLQNLRSQLTSEMCHWRRLLVGNKRANVPPAAIRDDAQMSHWLAESLQCVGRPPQLTPPTS